MYVMYFVLCACNRNLNTTCDCIFQMFWVIEWLNMAKQSSVIAVYFMEITVAHRGVWTFSWQLDWRNVLFVCMSPYFDPHSHFSTRILIVYWQEPKLFLLKTRNSKTIKTIRLVQQSISIGYLTLTRFGIVRCEYRCTVDAQCGELANSLLEYWPSQIFSA